MRFLVFTCLLSLRFLVSSSVKCAYDFPDRDGAGRHKLLSDSRIYGTIHGEWTHCSQKPSASETMCSGITLDPAKAARIWFTSKTNTDATIDVASWKRECEDHRASTEQNNGFVTRVLGNCQVMQGFLLKVWCRVNRREKKNVVYRVLLQSTPVLTPILDGCDSKLPSFTTFGYQIIIHGGRKHKIDLTENTFTRDDPTGPYALTHCYKCPV
ncbi:hypothetical protein RF11_04613 [Thelohanellus kitauei]|uniref:Uncharacterized protein n=1 Tax=Thelohanellus kitauei TaxID=669202 RepID=A0A0C2JQC1_THEKT|nr:hypothetical protein RF11_04613 [Thelohanellus kitauei]